MAAFATKGLFTWVYWERCLLRLVWRKGATAGGLDAWGWRELKALPVSWYDGFPRVLCQVEADAVWPEGLLDAMLP